MIGTVDGKNRTGRFWQGLKFREARLKGLRKWRVTALTSPLLLGFNDLERALRNPSGGCGK